MQDTINKNLLIFGIQQNLFCSCGQCLDVDRAVLIEMQDKDGNCATKTVCATCWDRNATIFGAVVAARKLTFSVIDGRQLTGVEASK